MPAIKQRVHLSPQGKYSYNFVKRTYARHMLFKHFKESEHEKRFYSFLIYDTTELFVSRFMYQAKPTTKLSVPSVSY